MIRTSGSESKVSDEAETDPDTTDPAEAFAALSDPTRMAILRALWHAEGSELSFSELREVTCVADPGRFNCHVGKLTDRFVRKADEGYPLRLADIRVLGAVLSGTVTEEGSAEPMRFHEPCRACYRPMTLRYENERVSVTCDDCEHFSMRFDVLPGVFDAHDREAFPRIAERYVRSHLYRVDVGFCPICEGPTGSELVPGSELDRDGEGDVSDDSDLADVPLVVHTCERCGRGFNADLGSALTDRPVVAGFFADHGVDARDASVLRFAAIDERARFLDRDPIRAEVRYLAGDEELTVVVDDSLCVRRTERTDR
jgi:DNA-binding transcriptional ArsR family regulator